jgi:hypothetical protein
MFHAYLLWYGNIPEMDTLGHTRKIIQKFKLPIPRNELYRHYSVSGKFRK